MQRMDNEHPRWIEFLVRLEGSEGCNFRIDPDDVTGNPSAAWDCEGGDIKNFSAKILTNMGLTPEEIAESFLWMESHGGHCDCEVVLNCGYI